MRPYFAGLERAFQTARPPQGSAYEVVKSPVYDLTAYHYKHMTIRAKKSYPSGMCIIHELPVSYVTEPYSMVKFSQICFN